MFSALMRILRGSNVGGVLLTTLVVFFLFIVMMVAAVNYINRQYKAATNQEEQQKSFRVAEAGVDYTLFRLRQGTSTMSALKTQGSLGAQNVNDPITNTVAGNFTLTFAEAASGSSTERMLVTSKGRTPSGQSCETVVATIEHANATYTTTSWKHNLGCN